MKVIVLVIFLATAGFAQEAVSNFKVDCSTVESSPGCQSFNEMVTKKDKDLMSYIAGVYDAYVCFRKDEDNFVVIVILRPYDSAYRKLPASPRVVEQDGHIFFQRYKDGLTDDTRVMDGKWRKASAIGGVFRTPKGSEPGAIVGRYRNHDRPILPELKEDNDGLLDHHSTLDLEIRRNLPIPFFERERNVRPINGDRPLR
jgi:hypothetical protein